jgi:hypothetical protein
LPHASIISSHLTIFVIIHGEEYKLQSSSLCNFLQPPITSPLLRTNMLSSQHCLLYTHNSCHFLNVRHQFPRLQK